MIASIPEVWQVLAESQKQNLFAAVLAVATLALASQLLTAGFWGIFSLLIPGSLTWLRIGFFARVRRRLAEPMSRSAARSLLARQVALITTLPWCVWGWYITSKAIIRSLHNEDLTGLGLVLSFLGVTVVTLLAAQFINRLVLLLLERLEKPSAELKTARVLLPSMIASGVSLIVLVLIAVSVAEEVDMVWVFLPAAAATLAILFALMRPPRALSGGRLVGLWTFALIPFLGFTILGNSTPIRMLLQKHGLFSPVALGLASRLTDVDRDGFGTFFGGGDCAAFDPQISPGAREIPGNAVDENCNGIVAAGITPPNTVPATTGFEFTQLPDILLITWDSARPDHFSAYGYPVKTTPFVDELARESTLFLNAVSSGPNTHHSVPALLTGKNIFNVSMRFGKSKDKLIVMEDDNVTFAEILKKRGYHTAGVFGHSYFSKKNKWNQGFDDWRIPVKANWKIVSSEKLSNEAIKIIQKHGKENKKPLFLWIHFYDPHLNYVKHKEAPFPLKTKVDAYDSELWFTDLHTRKVVEEMRKVRGDGVVILAADHGDSHGEHGKLGRHRTLHRECIHVPLLIHIPGAEPGIVEETVSLVDLLPTIADMIGGTVPDEAIGQSLLPALLHGTPPEPRPAWSEVSWPFTSPWEHFVAVTTDQGMMIREVLSGREELYLDDLDPRTSPNLIDEGLPAEDEMAGLLDQFLEVTIVPTPETDHIP